MCKKFIIIITLLGILNIIESHNNTHNLTKLDLSNYPGEDCYRDCNLEPGKRKTCYFKFVLELYEALGGACRFCAYGVLEDCFRVQCLPSDGVERAVMSINRQIPGPGIHVCEGDKIIVDVVNKMLGTSSTIHWHGFHMKGTQIYDGVPYVTQCPIAFGETFRYQFYANEPGTHFYHSHTGLHKANGHYGALIVRRDDRDPHRSLYNYDLKEHTMLISDLFHEMTEMFIPGMTARFNSTNTESMLFNGKGIYISNSTGPSYSYAEVFKVLPGKSYRFRVINGGMDFCTAELQIQGHNMTIIATDSFDVKPMTVDTLYLGGGERYDFVLVANQTPGDYCIKVRLINGCEFVNKGQTAVLSYSKDGKHEVSMQEYLDKRETAIKCKEVKNLPTDVTLNDPRIMCYYPNDTHYCSAELSALNIDKDLINATPDKRVFLSFDNNQVFDSEIFVKDRYEHYLHTGFITFLGSFINNISFTYPSFNLLTQWDQVEHGQFCDETRLPKECAGRRFCHCPHLIQLELDSIVEFTLVDENRVILKDMLNHVFHIHGHAVAITDMGQSMFGYQDFRTLLQEGKIPKNAPEGHVPPIKDSISIPVYGYTTVRFRASNPGLWLFHCHYDHHSETGMIVLLQVGKPEDWPKPPPNFPKCNNFVPDVFD